MTNLTDFRAVYLPYCLKKQADGSWVVLNRRYKPVGFNTSEWVDYENFPVSAKLEGLTQAKLSKLSYTGVADGDTVYLYNDGCIPTNKGNMAGYLEKLGVLAGLALVGM
jgi:hypothetical protein